LIKKLLSIVISVIMVFSAVQLPVLATDDILEIGSDDIIVSSDASILSDASVLSDSEISSDAQEVTEEILVDNETDIQLETQASANTFKATFDSLTPDAAFDNKNGASNYYSTGFIFANEAGSNGNGAVSRKSSTTSVRIVERENGNNAVKFVSSGNAEDAAFIGSDQIAQSVASTDIIHYSFDLKRDDMNTAVKFSFKDASYGYLWNFLRFETTGLITFHEKVVDNYVTGKWYNIEMFYIVSTGEWHLFINGKYAERVTKSCGITNLNVMRIGWTAPAGMTTTLYFDNLVSDYATSADLKGADKLSIFETVTFSNSPIAISSSSKKDNVDSSNVAYNNYAPGIMVNYENKGGKFGKAANDTASHIYNIAGYHTPASFGYFDYGGFKSANITPGAKLYYSAEFAIDNDTSNTVWLQLITQNSRPELLKIDPATGAISSLGSTFQGVKISKNQWYRIDLVITVGETGVSYNTLDVYLNGKKLTRNALTFNATSTDKSAMTSATIRNASYLTTDNNVSSSDAGYDESKTKYKANSIWFDNVTAGVYPAGNSVISPVLIFDNPNVDFYDDRIENVGRSTTVEQLIDGTYCNFPFSIVDAAGAPVTDTSSPAKGKIIVINLPVGGDIYIPVYDIPFPADYTNPTVELTAPSSGAEFYYDIDIDFTLKAEVDAYSTVDGVVFYLDGEELFTDTEAPYECRWLIPNAPGNHKLKASVVDYYGTYAESDDIDVVIKANAAPIVTIAGIETENDIYTGDSLDFTVTTNDTDGTITKTEVYLNNMLYDTFTQASKQYKLTFDQNGRQVIKVVTYDNFGYQAEATSYINVLKITSVDIGTFDFEGYSAGKTFSNSEAVQNASYTGNAIEFTGDRGKKEIVTENGNNYLKVGVASDTPGGSSSPYAAFTYNKANAIIDFKADMIFSTNTVAHTMVFRSSSSTGSSVFLEPVSFTNDGKIRVYNGGAANDLAEYEAGVWYRINAKFNYQTKKLDFKVIKLGQTDEVLVDVTDYTFRDQAAYSLTHIRFVPGFTSDNPGYIGYDNVEMSYVANYPYVTGFTDNLSSNGFVASNAESLSCIMSEEIGDIALDDIILENAYGKVTVASVVKNGNSLVITPKDGFVSSENYKLTIKSTSPLKDGSEFGYDTISHFSTGSSEFDVTDGKFEVSASGVTFIADIVNTTSDDKTITIVTTTYSGDVLVNVYSKTVTLSKSGDISSELIPESSSYDSVKAFVITNWLSGVPLSAKTFTYSK